MSLFSSVYRVPCTVCTVDRGDCVACVLPRRLQLACSGLRAGYYNVRVCISTRCTAQSRAPGGFWASQPAVLAGQLGGPHAGAKCAVGEWRSSLSRPLPLPLKSEVCV